MGETAMRFGAVTGPSARGVNRIAAIKILRQAFGAIGNTWRRPSTGRQVDGPLARRKAGAPRWSWRAGRRVMRLAGPRAQAVSGNGSTIPGWTGRSLAD